MSKLSSVRVWGCTCAAGIALVAATAATAAPVTLIDETFADGNVGPTPAAGNWVNSTNIEVGAGTGFATARAVATTYDHDNNAATAAINIPGGLEINGSAVSTLTITVTMPATIDPAPNNLAALEFWAAVRANNATGATYSVVNVTDGVTVVPATTPLFATVNTDWRYNSAVFPLLPTYAGDTFNVVFNGGGTNGANGLELTDMSLVANVPEPTGVAALGLAAVGLLRRRQRRA
jgi:hypothetical protein